MTNEKQPLLSYSKGETYEEEQTRLLYNKQRWYTSIPASCVLMLTFGSTYALSVFSIPLSEINPEFTSTLTSALGTQSFCVAIAMLVGGYFLDFRPQWAKYFAYTGCLINLVQLLVAYSAQIGSPPLLFFAICAQGFGCGVYYILGVEHMAQWLPDRPGLAMGCAMGSLGVGSIAGAKFFHYLIPLASPTGSPISALYFLTIVFVVPPILATFFGIRYPPRTWDPRSKADMEALMLQNPGVVATNDTGNKLGWKLLVQPQFYILLVIVAMGAGPCFGVMVSFPSVLKGLFGVSDTHANTYFATLQLVGMLTRFLMGFSVDFAGFGRGFFWSGGKNLSIVILVLQAIALYFIPIASGSSNFTLFMFCITILFMSFAASAVLAAVLSRHMFSPVNGGVVFGFAGGLTDGLATMLFSVLMASVQDGASKYANPAEAYNLYFERCLGWAILGAICTIIINRCNAAFEVELQDGTKAILIENEFLSQEEIRRIPSSTEDNVHSIQIVGSPIVGSMTMNMASSFQSHSLIRGISLHNSSYSAYPLDLYRSPK